VFFECAEDGAGSGEADAWAAPLASLSSIIAGSTHFRVSFPSPGDCVFRKNVCLSPGDGGKGAACLPRLLSARSVPMILSGPLAPYALSGVRSGCSYRSGGKVKQRFILAN